MSTTRRQTPDGRTFEALACDLSPRFTDAPAGQVEGLIDPALAELVTFFGVDRCSLGQFSVDGRDLIVTHCHTVAGVPSVPRVNLATFWPWYTAQIRRGRTLRFARLPEDAPEEAVVEREHARRQGLRSHLALPLAVGGVVLGGIGFATFGRVLEWTDEQIGRLRLVADVLANALGRLAAHRREVDLCERLAVLTRPAWEEETGAAGWVHVLGAAPEALGTSGRPVRQFASPAELLGATLTGPGCVVIDLDATGPAGVDAQADLAARELAPPVVLLTGRADPALVVRAMRAGVVDVLTRPFEDMALQEAVARGVERHARAIEQEREAGELRRRYDALSPREREVMALVVAGHPNKVAGVRLGICEKTVKAHRGAVMRKMGVASLADLVRMADRLRPAGHRGAG